MSEQDENDAGKVGFWISLSLDQIEELEQIAKEEGLSRNDLICLALDEYLEEEGWKSP